MLEQLKQLIDEANYPYFTDEYLQGRINGLTEEENINTLALELLTTKSGIEEIKLGDITIKSPSQYFIRLANNMSIKIKSDLMATKNANSKSRTLVRADGRK